MGHRVDEIDRRIIYRLAENARNISAPMIAEEMDISAGTIRNRISQLEEQGIIRGYHADVDYDRVEGRTTNLFVCTSPVPDRETLAQKALLVSGVVNVREFMAGRKNLHVTAVGTDTDDLARVARELSNLGLEIEAEKLIQNEHVHPYHPFGPKDGKDRSPMADFMSLAGDAEVVELTVVESAPVVGKTIAEADEEGVLGDEVVLIAIERGDTVITPKGDSTIEVGDVVTVFARGGVQTEMFNAFTTTVE